MRLSIALLSSSLSLAYSASLNTKDAKTAVHHPKQISYEALLSDELFQKSESNTDTSFSNALHHHGIISITQIPKYASQKREALQYLHECAVQSSPRVSKKHVFPDGTTRLTMATRTLPGPNGQSNFDRDDGDDEPLACASFFEASDKLRDSVRDAVRAFSVRLGTLLDAEIPLLTTENADKRFDSFEDVVEHGEHLEHFHSYEGTTEEMATGQTGSTIDMHTDQGLFIAFAPALTIDTTTSSSSGKTAPVMDLAKGDFYIETEDGGTPVLVEFGIDDDLVIMLGDGVNQYVNPRVKKEGLLLRATPHALVVKNNNHDVASSSTRKLARVWYGRMILPPPAAVHPTHDGVTFGQIRRLLIDTSLLSSSAQVDEKYSNPAAVVGIGIGCASVNMTPRQLADSPCAESDYYCWHRCFSPTIMASDYSGVSEESCAQQGLKMGCVNENDPNELWTENKMGPQFVPSCYEIAETDGVVGNETLVEGASTNPSTANHGDGHDHSNTAHGIIGSESQLNHYDGHDLNGLEKSQMSSALEELWILSEQIVSETENTISD